MLSMYTTLNLSVYRLHQDAGAGLAQLGGLPPMSHMLDADLLYKYQTNRTLAHSHKEHMKYVYYSLSKTCANITH